MSSEDTTSMASEPGATDPSASSADPNATEPNANQPSANQPNANQPNAGETDSAADAQPPVKPETTPATPDAGAAAETNAGTSETSSKDAAGQTTSDGEGNVSSAEPSAAAGDEPGDDVGNRVDGASATTTGEAPAKKKRRRRRKKKPGDGTAEAAAEGTEASDAATEEVGEGTSDEKKKKRRGKGPVRERPAFRIGEEVFGRVAKVTEFAVWIDIAGKATGLFDRRELQDNEPPQEGDQFIAVVASVGQRGGMLMLARAPSPLEEIRAKVEKASTADDEMINGFVTGAVKGGLEVDLGGLRAFAPASHVDLRPGADLAPLVGERLDFYVVQYAKKGRDIVVSRKKALVDEARKARVDALKSLEPGSLHKGVVRTVVAWGVFVSLPELEGVEGLVHMTEASHDRGTKLTDAFKPGQEIDVKVLKIDEKGKLWLSRKAAVPDPWGAVSEKYAVGTKHKGTVVRLQPFGAFVELEPSIDGLCHTADLSLKQIAHPEEVVKIGDELEFVVASCDRKGRRIGLHLAPSAEFENEEQQKVAQHRVVKASVVQAVEGGLIVRILGVTGRMARAFIPGGHTGTQRGTDLRKTFPVGMQLEAKVLDIDPRRGEAKLSIRAMKDDAEKQAYKQYRADVAKESKFGTFGDLMKKKAPASTDEAG